MGQRGWQGAHLVSSFWKDFGLSSQAIFFPPRPPVSGVMKSVIKGELAFLTVRNPATTVSVHGTVVRDKCFAAAARLAVMLTGLVTWSRLLDLFKLLLLPLKNEFASTCPLPGIVRIEYDNVCKVLSVCQHIVTAE